MEERIVCNKCDLNYKGLIIKNVTLTSDNLGVLSAYKGKTYITSFFEDIKLKKWDNNDTTMCEVVVNE